MKSDDFFTNVDSKLRKISEAEAASNDKAAENREFLQEVVARLAPVVASYKAKLKERNIHAEVQSYPGAVSYTHLDVYKRQGMSLVQHFQRHQYQLLYGPQCPCKHNWAAAPRLVNRC